MHTLPYHLPVGFRLQFTRSGLVLFTTVTSATATTGQRKAFPNPAKFSIDSTFQEKAAFAPWWSNMAISSGVNKWNNQFPIISHDPFFKVFIYIVNKYYLCLKVNSSFERNFLNVKLNNKQQTHNTAVIIVSAKSSSFFLEPNQFNIIKGSTNQYKWNFNALFLIHYFNVYFC